MLRRLVPNAHQRLISSTVLEILLETQSPAFSNATGSERSDRRTALCHRRLCVVNAGHLVEAGVYFPRRDQISDRGFERLCPIQCCTVQTSKPARSVRD